jgi:trehalose synthase
VLHDPQTVGLAPAVRDAGASVVWVCHVGVDEPNERARGAWAFLRPYVERADALVFSRRTYVWGGLPRDAVEVIPPCIDAFATKNVDIDPPVTASILEACGLWAGGGDVEPRVTTPDGRTIEVSRTVRMLEGDPVPVSTPVVAQVSRWDRLKDPVGVLRGFSEHVAPSTPAHLVLAGPDVDAVADDPEAAEVVAQLRHAYRRLPDAVASRIHLAALPMEDVDENAAIVNALQRRADVVVQKSLAEGFGLTVAEAMWKQRPVVGTRVGGIQDQIVDGESGLLVDPRDLAAFGRAVVTLLSESETARRIGENARERVCRHFLPPRYLTQLTELVERVVEGRGRKAS